MTDEIAFELGEFKFRSFYSNVEWKMNLEPFPLYYFFDWSVGGFGVRLKKTPKDTYVVDWENWVVSGKLKREMFTEISHKHAFIRGVLKSHYSKNIKPTSINLCWANSYNLRDMFYDFTLDVLMSNYGIISRDVTMTKGETAFTCPGTPHIKIEVSEEVINFLKDGPKDTADKI